MLWFIEIERIEWGGRVSQRVEEERKRSGTGATKIDDARLREFWIVYLFKFMKSEMKHSPASGAGARASGTLRLELLLDIFHLLELLALELEFLLLPR